jgi:hypothetical protein
MSNATGAAAVFFSAAVAEKNFDGLVCRKFGTAGVG